MDASPAQAANALAEVEGGSPAAVVLCPGLPWIWSLLIALSVIKIRVLCEPGERSWWCEESLASQALKVAQVASSDPHPHTQGLLFHPKIITFIHSKSVPNPCGAWTAHVQHLGVDV